VTRYDAAVLAWAAHLRSGSTTRWADFWPTAPAGSEGGEPPGAAQLELVRRLAERWQGPGFDSLADRVLHREGPGRGMARTLPLTHPAARLGVGAPPIDPSDVPVDELIRLGVGVLADLAQEQPPSVSPKQRRWFRRPHRNVSIQAPSLDELLTEVWSNRTRHGAAMPWRRFVRTVAARDALPLNANPARLAARAAKRVGPDRVHVYVGEAARAEGAFGVESTELLRRLNPVLALHVGEERLADVRGAAVRLLAGGAGPSLAVPREWEEWRRGRAERIASALSEGGYCVHGDLEEFVAGVQAPRRPRPAAVLDRLLDVVVRTVREEQV
jgi:hypothetical protein